MPKTAREIVKFSNLTASKRLDKLAVMQNFIIPRLKETVVVPIHNGDVPLGTEAISGSKQGFNSLAFLFWY
ncbi:type II toxin-antitoxin system HicA family toxin [Enterococcus faecium]|nr:hypothetical protein BVA20_00006 [Enterococcus faecium]